MATPTPSPSPDSPSPSLTTDSWRSVWQRRLLWLISALSGTLAIEQRLKEYELKNQEYELNSQEYELKKQASEQRLKILQKENERLAVLESKIDGLFLKYNIGLKIPQKPDQL